MSKQGLGGMGGVNAWEEESWSDCFHQLSSLPQCSKGYSHDQKGKEIVKAELESQCVSSLLRELQVVSSHKC